MRKEDEGMDTRREGGMDKHMAGQDLGQRNVKFKNRLLCPSF